MQDEVNARMRKEIRLQQRVIQELLGGICDPSTSTSFVHDGPGERWRYNLIPQKQSPSQKKVSKQLKSVVRVVHRRILLLRDGTDLHWRSSSVLTTRKPMTVKDININIYGYFVDSVVRI